jgi:TRAP-type C4-dicarboxylate transport system substrate-binding protein
MALLLAFADGAAAQSRTVKLATGTLNDAQHEWTKRFATIMDKNANGRLKVEIYPASQLGSVPRMVESTQLGSIQIWVGPPEFLVGVDQRFELLSAPGLFRDEVHALKVIADPAFSTAFLAIGANKGLTGASLFFTGPSAFAMRAPLRTLADFKGKKVRVLASPFQIEQLTRLGATGIALSLSDMLVAFRQGAVDGGFGSPAVFSALRYYDSAKYMTETGQAQIFSIAMFSKRWYDGLPFDLQKIVMAANRQAGAEVIPWSLDFIADQRKVWVDNGGTFIALSAADKAELTAKLSSVGDDIVKAKPELKPLWELLVATAKRTE